MSSGYTYAYGDYTNRTASFCSFYSYTPHRPCPRLPSIIIAKSRMDKERHARELADYLAANPGAYQTTSSVGDSTSVPQSVAMNDYPDPTIK